MAGTQREKVDADGFFAFRRYYISPVSGPTLCRRYAGTEHRELRIQSALNGQTINNTSSLYKEGPFGAMYGVQGTTSKKNTCAEIPVACGWLLRIP